MVSKAMGLASSRKALQLVDESHDYFGGSQIALEVLRLEVVGLRAAYPGLTQPEIAERLQFGPKGYGTNAFNLVVKREWDDVVILNRRMRLTNLVSIYEGWDRAVADELRLDDDQGADLGRFLQQGNPSVTAASVLGRQLTSMADVRAALEKHPHHDSASLSQLRACYRAFKEVRNALAHGGSIASDRTENAWSRYQSVVPRWPGGAGSAPELPTVVSGQPVVLTDRGVIGLAHVLQRMIVTFDADFSSRGPGRDAIIARWRQQYGRRTMMSTDQIKAVSAFAAMWTRLGMTKLDGYSATLTELRRAGTIF